MYPLLAEAMEEAGLQEVDTYIYHRENTVIQFIATRPIMDMWLAAEKRPGSWVSKRWWGQEGLDL